MNLRKLIIAASLFCPFIAPHKSFAANTYAISAPITLDFATMQVPGSSETDIISNASGAPSPQTGTGTPLGGTPSRGSYTITCTGTCTNTITIAISTSGKGTCNAGFTSMTTWMGRWRGGSSSAMPLTTQTVGDNLGHVLLLGTTATYGSTVAAGACAPTLTIRVTDTGVNTDFVQAAAIDFEVPVSITPVANVNLGYGKSGTAGTYAISTAGVVTASGGGVKEGGTPVVGNLTITGSTTQIIDITASNYVVNGGVTPSAAVGKYGAAAQATLPIIGAAAPGAGTTLLLGLTVTADGTQANAATATPTFDITVVYE